MPAGWNPEAGGSRARRPARRLDRLVVAGHGLPAGAADWVYNNTGRSLFAAALFHALGNFSSIGPFLDFGPGGYPDDAQRVSALVTAAAAAVVTAGWGPRTLARRAGR